MSLQDEPTAEGGGVFHARIERGAKAEGRDGLLGTVQQIIVDRLTGVLQAVVLHDTAHGSNIEIPAEYVVRSTGSHVYLDLDSTQLAERSEIARPYDPSHYVAVSPGSPREVTGIESSLPVVTTIEENAAELRAPERIEAPDTSREARGTPSATAQARRRTPSEEEVPAMEPGPTPSTTGELIHGRPTTSGMGIKSSVPTDGTSTAAPPVGESATEDDIATIKLPRMESERPEHAALEESELPLSMVPPGVPQVEPIHPTGMMPPVPSVPPVSEQPSGANLVPPPAAFRETRGGPLAERSPVRDIVTNLWQSMEARVALLAIVGLVIAGAVWRAISRPQKTSGERAVEEHEEPAEHEQREEERDEEGAHPIHRARWFGRGLALGVGLTTLYAPMRGAQLREQIADAIERWRERRL